MLRESIQRIEQSNPGFAFLPDMKVTHGESLLQLGELARAREVIEPSWDTLKAQFGEQHPRSQNALRALLGVHGSAGNTVEEQELKSLLVRDGSN